MLVIAPWNYPFLTAINTIVPGLIAGNAIVLKHASQTPLAGERLAQAFAHLPEGLFTNLFLDHATTAALIAERAFDFINFTGSVRGGQEIERAAAGTFVGTRPRARRQGPGLRPRRRRPRRRRRHADGRRDVQRRPVLLRHRAHLRPREPLRRLRGEIRRLGLALKLGSPLDEETTLGPMASKRFADTVRAQTAEASPPAPGR